MNHRLRRTSLAALAVATLATQTQAQGLNRSTLGQAATLAVRHEGCLVASASAADADVGRVAGESLPAVAGGFLADMVGSTVGAAVGALGTALKKASEERAFSATGATSMEFYSFIGPISGTPATLQPQSTDRTSIAAPAQLTSDLRPTGGACLILSIPARDQSAPLALPLRADIDAGELTEDWESLGLSRRPGVYVEAQLQRRSDGFRVRPVMLWYGEGLAGAPRRAAPAELHVTFAVPGAPVDGSAIGTSFAVSRISLPHLMPDLSKVYDATALRAHAGPVVPMRPLTGSAASSLEALTALETAVGANAVSLSTARRALVVARKPGRANGQPRPVDEALVTTLRDAVSDLEERLERLATALAARREAVAPERFGSTNVEARMVVIREPNAFGLAIANALTARATSLGTEVAAELRPDPPSAAWTAADTAWINAMNAVVAARAAYDTALGGGNAQTILTTQIALRNAQAAANQTAAASGRTPPYPDVAAPLL